MENYEVKGVSQATEIRKAYEEAVKANARNYRAISKTNLIYGWDEKLNKFIKAEIGQEWFDNPHYVEPVEEKVEEIVEQPIEQVVEEIAEEVKAEETVVKNAIVEEIKQPEVDYKALYEEKCKELESLKGKVATLEQTIEKKDNELDDLQEELDDIKDSAQVIKKLFL